jgi:hypothetical protein
MGKLRIDFEWQNSDQIQGEELNETFASLSISYDDQFITRAFKYRSKTVTKELYLPLYPMAEWFVLNWWYLFAEVYNPNRINYHQRHNLSFAQDGYALPDLNIRPSGQKVELIWSPQKRNLQRLDFLSAGQGIVDILDLKDQLSDLINQTIGRLEAYNICDTLLQKEWSSILNADEEEQEFCSLAASSGKDPYGMSEIEQQLLINLYNKIPKNIGAEFFPVCNFDKIEEEADIITRILSEIHSDSDHFENIKNIRDRVNKKLNFFGDRFSNSAPWLRGYEFAKIIRSEGLSGKIADIEYDFIGAQEVNLNIPKTINAISGCTHNNNLQIVFSNNNPQSKRFVFYRALYDYFSSHEAISYLITKSHTENQKANRAFAAECLIPVIH